GSVKSTRNEPAHEGVGTVVPTRTRPRRIAAKGVMPNAAAEPSRFSKKTAEPVAPGPAPGADTRDRKEKGAGSTAPDPSAKPLQAWCGVGRKRKQGGRDCPPCSPAAPRHPPEDFTRVAHPLKSQPETKSRAASSLPWRTNVSRPSPPRRM